MGHVDPGPERPRPVRELAVPHAFEEVQVLFDGPVSPGALLAGAVDRPPVFPDLVHRQVTDISLTLPDEFDRILIERLIVIRSVKLPVLPVEPQPAHVLLDGIDVFDLLGLRIRVVETQVAEPAVLGGQAEVEADGFGVADVEVAVRLGRESGMDLPRPETPRSQVFVDDLLDEIRLGSDCLIHGSRS